MEYRGEVLVAILKNVGDLRIAREEHWYRIPKTSITTRLGKRWLPQWLSFYHTKKFDNLKYAIHYYAKVIDIQSATGAELLPQRQRNRERQYCKLILGPLCELPQPIFSRRVRRIDFIPTTWQKFINAVEINDLWDDSPLEDRLWAELKRMKLDNHAERQEYVSIKKREYFLDFVIFTGTG